jgi:outer membrane protein TolC
VQNAEALYDQAVDEFQAGTSPRIDVTRTEVQLHTEQYYLSVAQDNFAVAKLTLGRAIGLPLGQTFEIAEPTPVCRHQSAFRRRRPQDGLQLAQ